MKNLPILFLLMGILAMPTILFAQPNNGIAFSYQRLLDSLGRKEGLRKKAVEQIVVEGDLSQAGDQKMLETLDLFLQETISAAPTMRTGKNLNILKNFHKEVKHLTLRHCNWDTLPMQLLRFEHLTEIVFDQSPRWNLQRYNDELLRLRATQQKSLLEKLSGDITSLTFDGADLSALDSFHLSPDLLPDLRELRLSNTNGLPPLMPQLLLELNKTYPKLGWLAFDHCELSSTPDLAGFTQMTRLRSLLLSRNRLTEVPPLPPNLDALDLSQNFIASLSNKLKDGHLDSPDFLFLDCNLLPLEEMQKFIHYPGWRRRFMTLTFGCNRFNKRAGILLADTMILQNRSKFLSFARRYDNDYKAEDSDCAPCEAFQSAYIRQKLDGTQWKTPQSTDEYRLVVADNNSIELRRISDDVLVHFFKTDLAEILLEKPPSEPTGRAGSGATLFRLSVISDFDRTQRDPLWIECRFHPQVGNTLELFGANGWAMRQMDR